MSRRFVKQYGGNAVIEVPVHGIILAAGTTVPADGAVGYAPGCIFHDLNAAAGAQLFMNEGTKASADFNAVQSVNNSTIPAATTFAVTDADRLTVGGVIVPQHFYLAFSVFPHATVTEWDLWIAPQACQVVGISYVPSTLQGGAMTATVVKATGTATPVKTTTPMHAADAINLNTGAYTVVSPTLTVTTADLVLAAGDRISLDFSAAPTAAIWALAIRLKRV